MSAAVRAGNAEARHSSRNDAAAVAVALRSPRSGRPAGPTAAASDRRHRAAAAPGAIAEQRREVVGEGRLPRPERLAAGQRRRLEDGPGRRRRGARPGRRPGRPRSATSTPAWRRSSRAQSARAACPPFTRWWIPADGRRRPDQLDDRLGHVVGVGRRADLVGDEPERLAGRGRPDRRRRGSWPGSRCPAARTARRSGRSRGPPAADAAAKRRRGRGVLAGQLRRAVGVDRVRSRRPGRSRAPSVRRPSKTSFVETTIRSIPRSAAARRGPRSRRRCGHRQLRLAGAAVDVGPGRAVDDDLGPVAVEQRADAVRGVEVEDRPAPRDRPERSGERRLLEGRHDAPDRAGRRRP